MRDEGARCGRCGAWLPASAPEDLCPGCLLLGACGTPPGLAGGVDAGSDPLEAGGAGVAGRTLGHYELEEEIGRGGMGVVYRARLRGNGRVVAIKTIRGALVREPRAVARFRAEAGLAARLRHPNIVGILEVGEFEGQPFFSMEHVDGTRLDQLSPSDRLSVGQAAVLVEILAGAVEYAHGLGVLHLDLKPGNVMVDRRGAPRILDFGLAKVLGVGLGRKPFWVPLGSPGYAAPEQLEGRHEGIGRPTDVYSLGAILHDLLVKRPPFVAPTVAELLRRVREEEPSDIRTWNPEIPADLAAICALCLCMEPARRYPTAGRLAEDLGRYRRREPLCGCADPMPPGTGSEQPPGVHSG